MAAHALQNLSKDYSFVLDCSLTMTWLFEDEASTASDRILDELQGSIAVVPTIWPLEVSNVLLLAMRKKRLSSTKAAGFIDALALLPIVVDQTTSTRAMHSIFRLADSLQITVYDAAYLELAIREKIPLATLDQELLKAAHASGVKTLPAEYSP